MKKFALNCVENAAGTQVHRYTGTQVHRYTGTQVHRYTIKNVLLILALWLMNETVYAQLNEWVFNKTPNALLNTTNHQTLNFTNPNGCLSVVLNSVQNPLNQTELVFGLSYQGTTTLIRYTLRLPNGNSVCVTPNINLNGILAALEDDAEYAIVPLNCERYGIYFSITDGKQPLIGLNNTALVEILVDITRPQNPTINYLHQTNGQHTSWETVNRFAVNSLTLNDIRNNKPRYLYTIGAGNSVNGEHKRLVRYTLTPNGATSPTTIINNIAQGLENNNLVLDYSKMLNPLHNIFSLFSEMEISPNGNYIALFFKLRNFNALPPSISNVGFLVIYDLVNQNMHRVYSYNFTKINGLEFVNNNTIVFNWANFPNSDFGGLSFWNFSNPNNLPQDILSEEDFPFSLSRIERGIHNGQSLFYIWRNPFQLGNQYQTQLHTFQFQGTNTTISNPPLLTVNTGSLQNVILPEQIDFQDYTFNNWFTCQESIHLTNQTVWNNALLQTLNHSNPNQRIKVSMENLSVINQPNLIFRNCDITIQSNATIRFTGCNVTFVDCNIRACNGGLWNEIRLNSSTLNIQNTLSPTQHNFKISHSRNGIICTDGSNLMIQNTRFKDNLTAIQIQDINGNNNTVFIKGNIFEGNRISYYTCPYDNAMTSETGSIGIRITNSPNITINNDPNILAKNVFSKLRTGILVRNSNVNNISHNIFQSNETDGIRVVTSYQLDYNNNTFSANQNGIVGINVAGTFNGNSFSNHSIHGISINRLFGMETTHGLFIQNNTFRNHHFAALSVSCDWYQTMMISGNNIQNNNNFSEGAGILLNGSKNRNHSTFLIQNNRMRNVAMGIFTNLIYNAIIQDHNQNNFIRLSGATSNQNFRIFRPAAIFVYDSENIKVLNNVLEISQNLVDPNQRITIGIATDYTPNPIIQENELVNFTFGIWLGSTVLNAPIIQCNQMKNCQVGLAFNWVLNALNPTQNPANNYRIGNVNAPADNVWIRTNPNLPFFAHTDCYYTQGNTINYYARPNPNNPNTIYLPTDNKSNFQYGYLPISNFYSYPNANFNCNSFALRRSKVNANQIASEKVQVYKSLTTDASLLPLLPEEQLFIQQYQNTNIAKLAMLENAVYEDSLLADSLIQTLVPDFIPESDYKTVLCAEKHYLQHGFICDSSYQILSNIAQKEIRSNNVVLRARKLMYLYELEHNLPLTRYYLVEADDRLSNTQAQKAEWIPINEETEVKIQVYPNPNDGNFFVRGINKITNVKLLDIYGKVILNEVIENDKMFNLNLTCGLYILIIENQTFKLLVN